MNKLKILFLVLAFFCYKSLIPAPMSYYKEKVSKVVTEMVHTIKQKIIGLSKSRYFQEMKTNWPLAADFVATVLFLPSIIVFARLDPYYEKTKLLTGAICCLCMLTGLFTDSYWQDYLDRVWGEEYNSKKDIYEK